MALLLLYLCYLERYDPQANPMTSGVQPAGCSKDHAAGSLFSLRRGQSFATHTVKEDVSQQQPFSEA